MNNDYPDYLEDLKNEREFFDACDVVSSCSKLGKYAIVKPRPAKIIRYNHGLEIKKSIPEERRIFMPSDRQKRGKITTFSRASSSRLRSKLLKLPSITGIYGVTLTFKKEAYDKYLGADGLRTMWNNFGNRIKGLCREGKVSARLYYLWRIELQQNGTPHFHIVLSTDNQGDIFTIRNLFFDYVLRYMFYGCPDNAFDVRDLNSCEEAFNYVCSHSTKHKRSQLGWQGRQWGILFASKEAKEFYNSGKVVEEVAYNETVSKHNSSYELSRSDEFKIKRTLKRLYWAKLRDTLKNGKYKPSYVTTKGFKGFGKKMRAEKCRHSVRLLAWRQCSLSSQFLKSTTCDKLLTMLG